MNLIERLRAMVQKLRRTPMPIADVVPMLQEAADEIERLTGELQDVRGHYERAAKERDALKLIANEHRDGRLANAEIVAALTAHDQFLADANKQWIADCERLTAERDYWYETAEADLAKRLAAWGELARAKQYHAAELADVVAERDSLQAQLTNIWK